MPGLQIIPAFSWDVSAWGQKAKSFVHDVVAKPRWDGIAQVDEIISSAALPQDAVEVVNSLPLSDKSAPLQQHELGAYEESEEQGWGDFDIDDTEVLFLATTEIQAGLMITCIPSRLHYEPASEACWHETGPEHLSNHLC